MQKGETILFNGVSCKGALVAFNGKVIHATADWHGRLDAEKDAVNDLAERI